MKPQWRDDLVCFVEKLEYDFMKKTGVLLLPHGSCTDMSACIALFKSVDPGVKEIRPYVDGKPDTFYFLKPDGEWRARRVRREENGKLYAVLYGRKDGEIYERGERIAD